MKRSVVVLQILSRAGSELAFRFLEVVVNSAARFAGVVALLIAPAAGMALESPTDPMPGLPFVIGRLDSSKLDLREPRLFVTPSEIAGANERAESEAFIRGIRDRVLAEADRHLALEVTPIDESWWEQAKDKPWADTYPDVYLHTMIIPSRSARPAAELALAFRLTGEDKYADKAISLLMNLAPYSFEPVHYDVGMNYTIWAMNVLRAYDLLGSRLTAAQREQLDRFMERAAVAVAKNDVYWMENNIGGGVNNHLAWHKLMLGLLGLFYDRPEMVEFCMYGRRGLVPLLTDGLLDDGLWLESSLTYQFAAIAPMMVLADCQQRLKKGPSDPPGIHEITAPNGRTLKQSYDAMFNVLGPDCLIPPIGDAYGARSKLYTNPLYEYCWKLWREPQYAWLIRQNPAPTSYMLFAPPLPSEEDASGTSGKAAYVPPIRSVLLPEHGYAFLRSHRDEQYWHNRNARMAFLTYDRSGVHANADKLSIMLFGLNRLLVPDVEGRATVPHAFSSKIQGELNRGALSQNTVMIDGLDQRCSCEMLDLIEYRDLPDEKRVTAADRRGILYPGVRQSRSLTMTPDYILDVFQVDVGDQPRQIDWIVHIMDENADAPADRNPILAAAEPFQLPDAGAFRWLRDVKSVVLNGANASPANSTDLIQLEWQDGQDRLGLSLLNHGLERLIFCGYPVTDQPDSGNIPMLMARANAPRAVFVAVWLIGDAVPDVQVATLPDHEGRLVYRVTAKGKTREHQIPKL